MARVNLEARLFGESRLRHLARMLKCFEHQALGIVAFLWHDSQEYQAREASADEIIQWSRIADIQDGEQLQYGEIHTTNELVIEALCKCRFIEKTDTDRFVIIGNDKQIEQLRTFNSRAKKGADARWKQNENASSNALAHAKACLTNAPIQFNSTQLNSIQTKNRSTAARSDFDFDAVYKSYPRKMGKKKGLAVCRAKIKTPEQYEKLRQAVDRYSAHVKTAGTEPEFIKHFSTFMNSWEDWLDPETGTAVSNVLDIAQMLKDHDAEKAAP